MKMAKVVCVHGIGKSREARETLVDDWAEAVCGGVSNAGGHLDKSEVDLAFYGIIFRPDGKDDPNEIPNYVPGDLESPLELELLAAMASVVPGTAAGEGGKGLPFQRGVAQMLDVVAHTPFFGGVAHKVVIWLLKEVTRYLDEPDVRTRAHASLLRRIRDDTRILIGHSLGSVVAYEVLCAKEDLPVRTLITIGSPLGVPSLLPRLRPPVAQPPGKWPNNVARWVNVADKADLVAFEKSLARVYGPRVKDHVVDNGATMHDSKPYLTAVQTGRAIIEALAARD
jgi:hypothetical protein